MNKETEQKFQLNIYKKKDWCGTQYHGLADEEILGCRLDFIDLKGLSQPTFPTYFRSVIL